MRVRKVATEAVVVTFGVIGRSDAFVHGMDEVATKRILHPC